MKHSAFRNFIPGFEKLLTAVAIEKVSAESYCQKYLDHLLQHKKYYLLIYADVLDKLLERSQKKQQEIALIDVGAGNGMLGIFAKFCGFKKVFINDIDPTFVDASRRLASRLNVNIDAFIPGDARALKHFFKHETADAIVGTDVIEHIYDLNDFFDTLVKINPSMVSVFTTASNPKNNLKISKLKKLQLKDEYEGGAPDDFALFGSESLRPFLQIREDIISRELPDLNQQLLGSFATLTRGMNEKDILAAISVYKNSKKMPVAPIHPTNTCNPLNSSWTERILSLEEYRSIYNAHGMSLKVYNGFYDKHKTGLKKYLNKLLNMLVNSLGIQFAPFIIFSGSKK